MPDLLSPDHYQNLRPGDGVSTHTAVVESKNDKYLKSLDGVLAQQYQKKLDISKEPEAIIIDLNSLPSEVREERTVQLQGKLDEYSARYKRKLLSGKDERSLLSTLYKREGLMLLLKFGSLNTFAYSRAVAVALNTMAFGPEKAEEMGHTALSIGEFQNACVTIESYVQDGGASLSGGTGLPNLK